MKKKFKIYTWKLSRYTGFYLGICYRKTYKKLEKNEEILSNLEFSEFAISGHTEGKNFVPWQMFDKTRYTLVKKR